MRKESRLHRPGAAAAPSPHRAPSPAAPQELNFKANQIPIGHCILSQQSSFDTSLIQKGAFQTPFLSFLPPLFKSNKCSTAITINQSPLCSNPIHAKGWKRGESSPLPPPRPPKSSCWALISFLALSFTLIFPPSPHPCNLFLFCFSFLSLLHYDPMSPLIRPQPCPDPDHPLVGCERKEESMDVKLVSKRP